MPELRSFRVGMANIFLKHTSASLTINENVRRRFVRAVFLLASVPSATVLRLIVVVGPPVEGKEKRRADRSSFPSTCHKERGRVEANMSTSWAGRRAHGRIDFDAESLKYRKLCHANKPTGYFHVTVYQWTPPLCLEGFLAWKVFLRSSLISTFIVLTARVLLSLFFFSILSYFFFFCISRRALALLRCRLYFSGRPRRANRHGECAEP